MKRAFLVGGLRSPIGSLGGSLSTIRADDLLSLIISGVMNKYPNLDWNKIGDVVIGCANQAGEDNRNIARMSSLLAGLPLEVPGKTVNRLCGSGLSSIIDAARYIQLGEASLMLAGGVEHMTRGPYVFSKSSSPFDRNQKMYDTTFGWRFVNPKMEATYGVESMGQTAENICQLTKISREDQDLFAYRSQQKAATAMYSKRLAKEILPIPLPHSPSKKSLINDPQRVFDTDEFIKPQTNLEVLSQLKPVFRADGTVTAGSSSGLNDGAGCLLLASEEEILSYDLRPLARIVSSAVVGCSPSLMGLGPVRAADIALQRSNLTWKDIDIIEINEAFAGQAIGCLRSWKIHEQDERVNPNGGAIALGHPLGMSGTRIALTAAIELQEKKVTYALVSMCIGVGQGVALILERC